MTFQTTNYLTLTVFATSITAFFMATIATADMVVEHAGAADPTTEQWVDGGGNQPAGPVFGDFGFDAWSIDDSSTVNGSFRGYTHQLNGSQITAAFSNGWSLSTALRMIDVPDALDFSASVAFNAGPISYGMAFGTQADGDPIVQLIDGFSNPNSTGPSFALEGSGGGYHSYDLVYDTLNGTADLFVDGIERISDYGGYTFNSGSTQISFGAQQSSSTGHAHYNSVQFSTVPEPGTTAILGLMFSATLLRRRAR